MERRSVQGVAIKDAVRPATRGLPWLWFRLGPVSWSRAETAWFVSATVAAGVAVAAFVRTATLRWQSFETNAFDLAFFDQIVFNTSRGRWFETSFVSYNFAGQHLEPVLLLYLPAYWLGTGPFFLTVSQAVVAGAAAWPLYFFARHLTHQSAIAFATVIAYLANPYLHRAIAFDFHPEVMVAGSAFLGAWAIVSQRQLVAVVSALSVLLFKEDAVFVALLLASLMWRRGMKREAQLTAAVAVAYAAIAVLVVMPLIRGGESSDLVDRYGYLFSLHGDTGLVEGVLLLPSRAARVLLNADQLLTVAAFLAASCVIAVWRPLHLLWLGPGLALALLSNHPPQRQLELHYAAELVPTAMILALVSADALRNRVRASLLASALAGPPLLAMVLLNPLAEGHGPAPGDQHRAAVASALALIPPSEDVSVSAQSGLLPRLSQRRQAHEFPGHASKAEWIVVDRYGFRSSQSLAAGFDEALEEVRRTAELVFSEDGVEVFRRAP